MSKKYDSLVSVIVPVYRKEDTLDACLTSIIEQTYKNIEIILIDDGSPDDCGNICDRYADKDSRIIVIHKENQGVSIARNVGLLVSGGRYITFVDADDKIKKDFIKHLLSYCTDDSDIIIGSNRPVNSNFQIVLGREEAIRLMFDDDNFGVNVWGKLFKKDFVEYIRFPEHTGMGEDMAFLFECLMKSKRVVYVSASNYIQNKSEYNSSNLSKSDQYYEALQIASDCKKSALDEGLKNCIGAISKAILVRALWTADAMIIRKELSDEILVRCRKEIRLNRRMIGKLLLKHKILSIALMMSKTFYITFFGPVIRRKYNGKIIF